MSPKVAFAAAVTPGSPAAPGNAAVGAAPDARAAAITPDTLATDAPAASATSTDRY